MHILWSYLKFLWDSKNHHGVHSPFLFTWITKCLYDTKKHSDYLILKAYRTALKANHNTIEVTDFGAGSRVFRSNHRNISAIAKNAGMSPKRAEMLYRMAQYFQPKNILEIGTSLGIGTSALALGNPEAKIVTLEGCPKTAQIAKEHFDKFGLRNIETRIGSFAETLPQVAQEYTQKLDMIFFDGNHTKEATLAYFKQLLPTAHNDSVWIFDDIHWSVGMEEAWAEIIAHPQISATLDTFQWGIVFFRKQQPKEHFTIRT